MRVVLVADNLEGFSSDETAALRLAAFLGALRQSVVRLDVILSLNQDIWQSAFVPRLSGGLTDRLSEVVIELNPLTEDEILALLESRVPGLGARVLAHVDRAAAGTCARSLIRAAGVTWLKASAMDVPPAGPSAAPPSSATEPAPVEIPVPQPTPSTAEVAVDSPFQIAPETDTPALAPEPRPAAPPSAAIGTAPVAARPPAASPAPPTDRVDGLLRQFLERYGRGNR